MSVLFDPTRSNVRSPQEPEQFDLGGGIDLANLIQKQRPTLGLLEPPDPPFVRAGERPLLVAEQFALQQRGGKPGAMDGHQRLLGPRAQVVDRLGDHLLARAGFPLDEHRRARRRHLLHQLEHRPHPRRLPDHVLQPKTSVQLPVKIRVFDLQGLLAQHAGDPHLQFLDLQPPLGNVVVGAPLHGFHGDILRPVGGHEDAHRRPRQGLRPNDQLHAVLSRQAQIGQQHLETLPFEEVQGVRGILGHVDIVTILQSGAQTVPRRLFVVHDQ